MVVQVVDGCDGGMTSVMSKEVLSD